MTNTKYIHCIKGSSYVYHCGKGTVFNSDKGICLSVSDTPHDNVIEDQNRFQKRYNVILI